MSRKTNKTNHVLSLLSTGVKAEEEKEVNIQENSENKQEVKKEQFGNVAVVKNDENDVAEDIRRSLEKEMEEYEAAVKQAQPSAEQKKEPAVSENAPKTDKQEKSSYAAEETGEDKSPAVKSREEEEEPQNEEDNYILVNVMEALVKERVPEYMRQFEVCGCRRCQMAVEAEALSELPGKYVVINRYAISPLINFYRTKFAGRVTVEVAKACMAVKNSNRHSNDDGSADEKSEKKSLDKTANNRNI